MSTNFQKEINKLNRENYYPFHMPGHKRQLDFEFDPYKIDITEIDGYDNLHNPEGMILELENRLSALYKAEKSYVLVNGSTCGVLSAISAVTEYGDRILAARNSHKSAFHAIQLRGLDADYIYPEYIEIPGINGGISLEKLKEIMEENRNNSRNGLEKPYSAVYITSPTYEGIVSDIKRIAEYVHTYGIPLIVDEAHGAHLGLSEHFPQSAVTQGADIVIQSIHKTLMGMTQTAVLHLNSRRIDMDKLEYYLKIYQTSSPSYVLMASVENTVRMIEEQGKNLFDNYIKKLNSFLSSVKNLKNVHIFEDTVEKNQDYLFDCGKLIIYSGKNQVGGRFIYDFLREKYKLQMEMCYGNYVIGMTSCMDTEEGFSRLREGLEGLDKEIEKIQGDFDKGIYIMSGQLKLEKSCTIAEAFEKKKEIKELKEGQVCGDYIYIYPPGIPLIVPGEKITSEAVREIKKYIHSGFEVRGIMIARSAIQGDCYRLASLT